MLDAVIWVPVVYSWPAAFNSFYTNRMPVRLLGAANAPIEADDRDHHDDHGK